MDKALAYVTQALERATQLGELLPRAQLGGSYVEQVYSTLRSLGANLESAKLELEALRPTAPPQP